MKKFILLTLTAVLTGSTLFAQSRIITDTIASPTLGRGVPVNVYIPRGFDDPANTYPVLYLLHGLYGTHRDWPGVGGMQTVLDELIGTGEAVPMVVIMPCAGDNDVHHVQNGYFNVEGNAYEDFFFGELMPAFEGKYRCGGSKGMRAIAGLSMGGGGSIVYSQRHPDLFSSCYSMSGWLDTQVREARTPEERADKLFITNMSVREHSALDFVDNADEATISALKGVKWFLDCGDDDSLMDLSVKLHLKMKAKGIKSELRIRNGVHNWEYWHTALRLSLPFASRNFGK